MDGPAFDDISAPTAPLILRWPLSSAPETSVIVASPHSGRDYSAEFLDLSRLDLRVLRQSEDSFVDELVGDAPSLGVPLLAATFPRAFCDVNRERWELDPDMFSDRLPDWCTIRTARIAAGHGTVPRVAGHGERIHRRKLRFDEARDRIDACWAPYHQALDGLVERTRARRGSCLLVDCHSMPAENGALPADFILGDNHGASCSTGVMSFVEDFLAQDGSRVRRNEPYAGGFVTRHYGQPGRGVHVLQLEMSRHLYLDETTRERQSGFQALRLRLSALIASLAARPDLLGSVP